MGTTTTTGLLRVPGASLYYEVRGTGPMLLISESGDGLAVTLRQVAKVLGISLADPGAEADLTPHPMTPQRIADFGFFVERDFTAIIEDTLPVTALKDTTTRIVSATGRTTPRTVFDHRCAQALAGLPGTEIAEFPCGHNGNISHPRAYAARLRPILKSLTRTGGS